MPRPRSLEAPSVVEVGVVGVPARDRLEDVTAKLGYGRGVCSRGNRDLPLFSRHRVDRAAHDLARANNALRELIAVADVVPESFVWDCLLVQDHGRVEQHHPKIVVQPVEDESDKARLIPHAANVLLSLDANAPVLKPGVTLRTRPLERQGAVRPRYGGAPRRTTTVLPKENR